MEIPPDIDPPAWLPLFEDLAPPAQPDPAAIAALAGTWYMQPGDLGADFVFELRLNQDGTGTWSSDPLRWEVTGGKLNIFSGNDEHPDATFRLDDPTAAVLSGGILVFVAEEESEPDDEDYVEGGPVHDFAVLMRDDHGLMVVRHGGVAAAAAPDEAGLGELVNVAEEGQQPQARPSDTWGA